MMMIMIPTTSMTSPHSSMITSCSKFVIIVIMICTIHICCVGIVDWSGLVVDVVVDAVVVVD